MSGVPVFRMSDGSMSADFLKFLGDYNAARKRAGLDEAKSWFSFSVPAMFLRPTEKEAWAYWRWRVLRAAVAPAVDYVELMRLVRFFGQGKVFVKTSNCDLLHVKAGGDPEALEEIHGSLRFVQCAAECSQTLWPVDDAFVARLEAEPAWVPRCPKCNTSCLRPNVMIFEDDKLVHSRLEHQSENFTSFCEHFREVKPETSNFAVVEIGAGTVVASIRSMAETYGAQGKLLIRVNPSEAECAQLEGGAISAGLLEGKYVPLVARSTDALAALSEALML